MQYTCCQLRVYCLLGSSLLVALVTTTLPGVHKSWVSFCSLSEQHHFFMAENKECKAITLLGVKWFIGSLMSHDILPSCWLTDIQANVYGDPLLGRLSTCMLESAVVLSWGDPLICVCLCACLLDYTHTYTHTQVMSVLLLMWRGQITACFLLLSQIQKYNQTGVNTVKKKKTHTRKTRTVSTQVCRREPDEQNYRPVM